MNHKLEAGFVIVFVGYQVANWVLYFQIYPEYQFPLIWMFLTMTFQSIIASALYLIARWVRSKLN